MNDNDIIRALECCISSMYKECQKCPLYADPTCRRELQKDAVALIKRQQAEIERLNNNISAMAVTMRNSAKALVKFLNKYGIYGTKTMSFLAELVAVLQENGGTE